MDQERNETPAGSLPTSAGCTGNATLLVGLALGYFTLNALLLGLVSSTAEWDNAEQLILTQVWQLGYNSQPPLYTWLVKSLFLITGPSLPVLLGVKAALLTLMVASVVLAARELELSPTQQWIAALGLALIPQIVWEDQRNFTHTVLAVTVAGWTLLQLLRLRRRPTTANYLLLGLLLGLGTLSKYNYGLFAAGLAIAALSRPSFRMILWSWRMVAGLALAGALLLPHLLWVVSNPSTARDGFHKLEMTAGMTLSGLAELGSGLLASLGVLVLVSALVVRPRAMRAQATASAQTATGCRLLLRGWLAMVLLAAALTLATGARDFQEHWLQPLVFFVPLLLACWADPFATRGFSVFRAIATLVLVAVSIALPGQALFANPDRPSRLNLPYAALAAELRAQAGLPNVIVAPSDPLAGNLRLRFPQAMLMSERNLFSAPETARRWIAVSERPLREGSVFVRWLEANIGLPELDAEQVVRAPLRWLPGKEHSLFWTRVQPRRPSAATPGS